MNAVELPVSFDDVRRAANVVDGQLVRTPCTHSRVLSKITGAEVWIKFENFQFTASFKERGALNKLMSLRDAERARSEERRVGKEGVGTCRYRWSRDH